MAWRKERSLIKIVLFFVGRIRLRNEQSILILRGVTSNRTLSNSLGEIACDYLPSNSTLWEPESAVPTKVEPPGKKT
jgi:hypothetical protein